VVYVSEASNAAVMSILEKAAEEACKKHGARVVNVFQDVEYNRTGFTLGVKQHSEDEAEGVGGAVEPLRQSAMALTERALSLVDLRNHSATHPRCGVVDHISCHALGETDAAAAVSLARHLGEGIGGHLHIPVLMYGLASPVGAQLADLRRQYGYFRETAVVPEGGGKEGGGCGGWVGAHVIDGGRVEADYGPSDVSPEAGIVMLGATPWAANYNVPLRVKLSSRSWSDGGGGVMKAARRVARRVSERGGGLPAVQAMALLHGGDQEEGFVTVEIACNLLDVTVTGAAAVQAEVDRLCEDETTVDSHWRVDSGYMTNMTPDGIMAELYVN